MFDTIALLVTGIAGMLGWYFAWAARGDALDQQKAAALAAAGEAAARELATEANAKAATATAQQQAAATRADHLQAQLDAERKGRQDLVDALAKSGAPVGPVVVDTVLGGLYPSDPAAAPSAGAGADAGGGGPAVPGEPAAIARTTTRR